MKFLEITKDFFKDYVWQVKVDVQPVDVSICCGFERSTIYPRDCPHCGGLFIPASHKR